MFEREYKLTSIVYKDEQIANIIARKAGYTENKLFAVNEIFDKQLIFKCLKDFLELKQSNILGELEDCFSENGNLYVVFQFNEGESLEKYLEKRKPNFEERLEIAKALLLSLSRYMDAIPAIQLTILEKENILYYNKEIYFNFFIHSQLNNRQLTIKEVYTSLADWLSNLFDAESIQKNKKLSIVIQKCYKHLYSHIPEIYKEMCDIIPESFSSMAKQKWEEKQSRVKVIAAKVSFIVGVIAVIYVLVSSYNKATPVMINEDSVRQIGTVPAAPTTPPKTATESPSDIVIDNPTP